MKQKLHLTALVALASIALMLATSFVAIPSVKAMEPSTTSLQSQTTCYGGARSTGTLILDTKIGPYFTTNRCGDINVYLRSARYQTDARSCLERVVNGKTVTISCSAWKLLPFKWTTLSTNVLDGTRFRLEFRGNDGEKIEALVAS